MKVPFYKGMDSKTMLAAELLIIKHVQECNFSSKGKLVLAGKKLRSGRKVDANIGQWFAHGW